MVSAELCEQLRLAIYRHFASQGRPPSIHRLAADHGVSTVEVTGALRVLAEQRHLVLGEPGEGSDAVRILMAHPFSAIPLGFAVMGPTTLWWGGCAWDAFALPHLLPDVPEVLVATDCPACRRPHAFRVTTEAPPVGDEVAHFLVPAAHMWDDVVRTCSNQRIFCSEACVDDWLATTDASRGCVLDLSTLWRLAAHWYDGRLEPGYERREPADARDYLRSVGLDGTFWGH